MPDDLLVASLCELGERVVAMREALADPSVATKPHARAVAALLNQGLDAIVSRLQKGVLEQGAGAWEATPATLGALYQCGQALRALHCRLGLLDVRWSAAPVDIFLRKLRDDVGADLPHPAVVLSDDYAALDTDVAERLYSALKEVGIEAPDDMGAEAPIALPRIESGDPLSWPLLLPALARAYLLQQGRQPAQRGARSLAANPTILAHVAVRLIGPSVFAAQAAQALLFTPVDAPAYTARRAAAQRAASSVSGGLDSAGAAAGFEDAGFEDAGVIALFARLLCARDAALGLPSPQEWAPDTGAAVAHVPDPAVPTADEAAALLAKLAAGTPINAVDPPVPEDFLRRLQGVDTPDDFYALIGPLGERAASLAAILGVGWLYKVRYSYPLFRRLVGERGDVAGALAAYRPHLVERNELLAQSIEAAHVQGIFARGKLEAG